MAADALTVKENRPKRQTRCGKGIERSRNLPLTHTFSWTCARPFNESADPTRLGADRNTGDVASHLLENLNTPLGFKFKLVTVFISCWPVQHWIILYSKYSVDLHICITCRAKQPRTGRFSKGLFVSLSSTKCGQLCTDRCMFAFWLALKPLFQGRAKHLHLFKGTRPIPKRATVLLNLV